MDNRYNLIDEAWIPISGAPKASLADVFRGNIQGFLGGSPMEKVAIMKLLLAIAQAAHTPENEDQWKELGSNGMGKASLDYLDKWHDTFWLYGDKPFLQMPAIAKAAQQPLGALVPQIAVGNTTILQDLQKERALEDSRMACLVVSMVGYGFGGKKADNSIVLTQGYGGKSNDKGKPATGKPGPWLGFLGYLHHFLVGSDVLETVWFNLLTQKDIADSPLKCRGIPPWEAMPQGEACDTGLALRDSLMGRLVPLSKFFLLNNEGGLHYSEGIAYLSHKEGGFDPSIAILRGKEIKALWVDPRKSPWRMLPSLLAFLNSEQGYECYGLQRSLSRVRPEVDTVGVWAGGIKVSSNAGEQYVSGKDDYVDSLIYLPAEAGSDWHTCLTKEMDTLTSLEKMLYACVRKYADEMNADPQTLASSATTTFWSMCDKEAQQLIFKCHTEIMPELQNKFLGFVRQAYDAACPRETVRQLKAWAKCRPHLGKFAAKTAQEG